MESLGSGPGPVERRIATTILVAVIVACCVGGVLFWQNRQGDCENRGGHWEPIYGKNLGWTCAGANR